ncbi:myosin-10-like [Rhipicephalus sanguineus]|uniref:myosin-10-like n=1 Tax=Rhipicephalus sanguineus TaxID=34632 RepID=UPI001893D92C|nr:myosin-10-like [Rhipicephalus sanguineus]
MADPGARVVHIFSGQVAAAENWPPIRLKEVHRQFFICALCRTVPNRTVVLPCRHCFCDSCHSGIVEVNGSVCPLCNVAIKDRPCRKINLPAKEAGNLEALCLNDGCDFVGSIEEVVQHYEKECKYHTVQCPRCQRRILHRGMVSHYLGECIRLRGTKSSPSSQSASCASGAELNMQEPNLTKDPLSTIMRQVNELLELNKTSDSARLQDFSRAVTTFEDSCLHFMENIQVSISSMVAERVNMGLEEVKALIRGQCSNNLSTVESQANESVDNLRQHDASRSEPLARALRDSECRLKDMKKVQADRSSRHTETLESLQRSTDSQRLNAGLEELMTFITDLCSGSLSTVQSRVNELVALLEKHDASQKQKIAHSLECSEEIKKQLDTLFKDMISTLRDSESRIKEEVSRVEANIYPRHMGTLQLLRNPTDFQPMSAGLEESEAFVRHQCSDPLSRIQNRKLDALLRLIPKTVSDLDHLKRELAKTVDALQNKVDALRGPERELKEQVARVEGNVSSRLEKTVRFLQRTIESLQLNYQSSQRDRVSAVVPRSDADIIRFSIEERIILRKLDSFSHEITSTLELLRQQINRDRGEPWVSAVYEIYERPCRRLPSNNAAFWVRITLNKARKKPSDLVGWNQWIYRDVYMKLLFRSDRSAIQVHVDLVDFSGNSRTSEVTLKALHHHSQTETDFEKVHQEQCKNCSEESTSHLSADFEIERENLLGGFITKNGKLKLMFNFS